MAAGLARFLKLAPGTDPKTPEQKVIAEIDTRRRLLYHERFLQKLLDSSPRPEVVWDTDEIRRSVEALAEVQDGGPRVAQLLAAVFARSGEPEIRLACLRGLRRMNVEEARYELRRLSGDPSTGDSWRSLCLLYLAGGPQPAQSGAPGGQ